MWKNIKVKTVQHTKPKEEAVKTVDNVCRTCTEIKVECNYYLILQINVLIDRVIYIIISFLFVH